MTPTSTTKTFPIGRPLCRAYQGQSKPQPSAALITLAKPRHRISALGLMITCFLIISLYPAKGVAMSLLFGTEVVLFSPMDGRITHEGKPVANARIIRLVKWKDDVGESESFYTDKQGYFHLPLKQAKVRIPPLAEFVISQSLFVHHDEQEFQVWGRTKRGTALYDELGGRPIGLQCELTDEVDYIDVPDGLFGTSCKWEKIEKQGE